jgi:transcriptional regulator with XRE-family HTH domain
MYTFRPTQTAVVHAVCDICTMADLDHDDLAALGRAIRGLREQSGLTLRELASATGLRPVGLREIEDGQVDPGFALLVRVAEALGVEPAVIFCRAKRGGTAATSQVQQRERRGAPKREPGTRRD